MHKKTLQFNWYAIAITIATKLVGKIQISTQISIFTATLACFGDMDRNYHFQLSNVTQEVGMLY